MAPLSLPYLGTKDWKLFYAYNVDKSDSMKLVQYFKYFQKNLYLSNHLKKEGSRKKGTLDYDSYDLGGSF